MKLFFVTFPLALTFRALYPLCHSSVSDFPPTLKLYLFSSRATVVISDVSRLESRTENENISVKHIYGRALPVSVIVFVSMHWRETPPFVTRK